MTTARYVAIVPLNANSRADWFNETTVSTADRELADAVLNALHSWGKYKYTIDPKNADLIIAVRAGRAAEMVTGPRLSVPTIRIGRSQQGSPSDVQPRLGLNTAIDVGPSEDALAVFVGTDSDSGPLWIHRKRDGLRGKLPLFVEFRKDVEKSEQILADKHP
ncbi:MAG: hypothetical protein NVS9B15_24300 [Acidobacteriaceae bacterium]